jgi:oligoendopeptidase F
VWKRSLSDPAGALALYKKALSLGGTRGLSDLFAAAGGKFDMGEDTIRPLIEAVRAEWAGAA